MSIKPVYAELIKSGQKTIELRRIAPNVSAGDVLVIYESTPVQRITAYCEISSLVKKAPETLWEEVKDAACLSHDSFISYFDNSVCGAGIVLGTIHILESPIRLKDVSPDLRAPQSYRYLSREQFEASIA